MYNIAVYVCNSAFYFTRLVPTSVFVYILISNSVYLKGQQPEQDYEVHIELGLVTSYF